MQYEQPAASQGGGFQVDTSGTPGGRPTGNKDRQSLIPTTIKQLKNAPPQANGDNGFTLDGKDLYQVTVCGLIVSADEASTSLQYVINDGTGTIQVKMWMDSDGADAMAERKAQWKEGVVVRVVGNLRVFNSVKSLVAYSIQPIKDFNEYTFHFIDVVHTHLLHTKGKPEPPAAAAPAGYAPAIAGGIAPTGGASYAAPQQGASALDLVLKFFQSKGEASESGCTVTDAANALASSNVTVEQVRQHVEHLVNEGHLYSTIDDDHFKSTA